MSQLIFCYACNEELDSYNILICAECLGQECEDFLREVETPFDEDEIFVEDSKIKENNDAV